MNIDPKCLKVIVTLADGPRCFFAGFTDQERKRRDPFVMSPTGGSTAMERAASLPPRGNPFWSRRAQRGVAFEEKRDSGRNPGAWRRSGV